MLSDIPLNRDELPPGEASRIKATHETIANALRAGPKTNVELSELGLDYGRAIRAMRADGYTIVEKRIDGGVHEYTLLTTPEPFYIVTANVILADGTMHRLSTTVRASTPGKAKNRAQHLFAKVEDMDAKGPF